ncbi:Nudix hydrolase 14 [Diplonema papillatum]|nr:Nudix hydrolase 14 [Diplonema papillatum]
MEITVQGRQVPVTVSPGVDGDAEGLVAALKGFPPFESWLAKADAEAEFLVSEVRLQGVEHYKSAAASRLGVCKIHAKLVRADGVTIPSTFTCAGGSTVCLISLRSPEGIDHIVVHRTLRPAIGHSVLELPGGITDSAGSFRGRHAEVLARLLPNVSLTRPYVCDLLQLARGKPVQRLQTTPHASDESVAVALFRKEVGAFELQQAESNFEEAARDPTQTVSYRLVPLNDLAGMSDDARLLASCYILRKVLAAEGAVSSLFTAKSGEPHPE